MNKKKQKLHMLKKAVMHMKKQLAEITSNNTSQIFSKENIGEKSKYKDLIISNRDGKLSAKKQTHFLRNHMPKEEIPTNKQYQTKQCKQFLQKHSSDIKNIMQTVDSRYYQTNSMISYQQSQRRYTQRTKIPQMQSLVTIASLTDRKYYQSICSEVSDKDNEQNYRQSNVGSKNDFLSHQKNRIKIFSLPYRDPILSPAQQKHLGKKVVKRIEKSPSNFLTSNPKFNDNLKFLGNVGIVSQTKGRIERDRNRSLIFQRIGPLRQGRSCSKSHFGRYFEQQYSSCI